MEIKIWEASSTGGFEDIVEEISQKVRQRDGGYERKDRTIRGSIQEVQFRRSVVARVGGEGEGEMNRQSREEF